MLVLKITEGADSGKRFDVEEGASLTLGRLNCDIKLEDTSVSREHAMISHRNGRFYVTDLESHNGTWVNGHPIKMATVLRDGSEIWLGRVRATVALIGSNVEDADSPDLDPNATIAATIAEEDRPSPKVDDPQIRALADRIDGLIDRIGPTERDEADLPPRSAADLDALLPALEALADRIEAKLSAHLDQKVQELRASLAAAPRETDADTVAGEGTDPPPPALTLDQVRGEVDTASYNLRQQLAAHIDARLAEQLDALTPPHGVEDMRREIDSAVEQLRHQLNTHLEEQLGQQREALAAQLRADAPDVPAALAEARTEIESIVQAATELILEQIAANAPRDVAEFDALRSEMTYTVERLGQVLGAADIDVAAEAEAHDRPAAQTAGPVDDVRHPDDGQSDDQKASDVPETKSASAAFQEKLIAARHDKQKGNTLTRQDAEPNEVNHHADAAFAALEALAEEEVRRLTLQHRP